jgi:hypothetical protein
LEKDFGEISPNYCYEMSWTFVNFYFVRISHFGESIDFHIPPSSNCASGVGLNGAVSELTPPVSHDAPGVAWNGGF